MNFTYYKGVAEEMIVTGNRMRSIVNLLSKNLNLKVKLKPGAHLNICYENSDRSEASRLWLNCQNQQLVVVHLGKFPRIKTLEPV